MVVSCLQTVVQPVRMEEHAIVHLLMLTVTVPVGTQETTARPEVSTTGDIHVNRSWIMSHAMNASLVVSSDMHPSLSEWRNMSR